MASGTPVTWSLLHWGHGKGTKARKQQHMKRLRVRSVVMWIINHSRGKQATDWKRNHEGALKVSKCNSSLSTLLSTGADITYLIQNDLSAEILMHIASAVNSLSEDTFRIELHQNRRTEQPFCRNSFAQKPFIIISFCTWKTFQQQNLPTVSEQICQNFAENSICNYLHHLNHSL